jgi:hypothetical protein
MAEHHLLGMLFIYTSRHVAALLYVYIYIQSEL